MLTSTTSKGSFALTTIYSHTRICQHTRIDNSPILKGFYGMHHVPVVSKAPEL